MKNTLSFNVMSFVRRSLPDGYELKHADDDRDGTKYAVVLKSDQKIQVATVSVDGMTVVFHCGSDEKSKTFTRLFNQSLSKEKKSKQSDYDGFLNRKVPLSNKEEG